MLRRGNALLQLNRPPVMAQMPWYNFATMKVKLPDLGEGTKEATVKEWYVKVGDTVAEFDDLVEVYTDKLVAKIPSTADGVVTAIEYQEDDVCLVGHALLSIETEGGAGET